MARQRSRAFWTKLVREVETGKTQAAVAAQHGVSRMWLGRWCARLRREATPAGLLLPVHMAEASSRRLEARIGDVVLAFDEGTDVAYVAALLRSVSA